MTPREPVRTDISMLGDGAGLERAYARSSRAIADAFHGLAGPILDFTPRPFSRIRASALALLRATSESAPALDRLSRLIPWRWSR